MYRKPGYTLVTEGEYIPNLALGFTDGHKDALETVMSECIKEIGPDRTPLSTIVLPELLKMHNAQIIHGRDDHRRLVMLMVKFLNKSGFLTEDVQRVTYIEDPRLDIETLVSRMLTQKITWFTKEQVGGPNATLLDLKTIFPIWLRTVSAVGRFRDTYYERLRLKIGDIGFKMLQGQPIDQTEKTFFLTYVNMSKGEPGHALKLSGAKALDKIKAAPLENPLVMEAYDLMRQSAEPGPGSRFFVLQSNKSFENLIYYMGNWVRSLPLSLGIVTPVGPFRKYTFDKLEERSWSAEEQLRGLRDHFASLTITKQLGAAGVPAPAKAALFEAIELSWTINSPIRVCGTIDTKCVRAYLDQPDIFFRLKDESNCLDYVYEYNSAWRARLLSSAAQLTPASADSYYLDQAIQKESMGEGLVDQLNMDAFGIVDFMDGDNSIERRRITFQERSIPEKIWYVTASNTLEMKIIDLALFYKKTGLVGFRPAFAEYYAPPRSEYFIEDAGAIEYINAMLGLTQTQAIRNRFAVSLSHNVAALKRLRGLAADVENEGAPFAPDHMINLVLLNKNSK